MHQHAMNEEMIAARLGAIVISLIERNEPLTKEKVGGREIHSVVLRARDIMEDINWLAREIHTAPEEMDEVDSSAQQAGF